MWAQETFGGKTMVWAHNIHIAKGIIDEIIPLCCGAVLKERLDNNYVTMVVQLRREFYLIQRI